MKGVGSKIVFLPSDNRSTENFVFSAVGFHNAFFFFSTITDNSVAVKNNETNFMIRIINLTLKAGSLEPQYTLFSFKTVLQIKFPVAVCVFSIYYLSLSCKMK